MTKQGATVTLQWLREQLDDREAEIERLRKIIRVDHELKAAQGGSPCTCEFCR